MRLFPRLVAPNDSIESRGIQARTQRYRTGIDAVAKGILAVFDFCSPQVTLSS